MFSPKPPLAVAAVWISATTSEERPIRVIRRAPDRITEFGAARFVSDTMVIDVRVSDLPDPHPGDLIVIGADLRARVLADLAARSDAAGIIATAPAAAAAKDGPIIAAAWKPVTTPSAEPARLF